MALVVGGSISMQSAIFGPPKYSIIPELVKTKKISKANGLITSFTYLGIIVGTFLASALTQITNNNYVLTACVCVVIAIFGFLSSLCIPHTVSKGSRKRINPLFMVEIYRTMRSCRSKPFLLVSICGASTFLFVGAFFQLNVIPYAMQSLHLTEVGGGYLFLVTAIGIAFGAIFAGKLSKRRVELGLSCLAGLTLVIVLALISVLNTSFYTVTPLTVLVGFTGGLFIVPFDSYIQSFSPDKERGQIVAASNFLSFCGVLLAPMCLYLFSGILKLQASTGFFLVALIFLGLLSLILPKISHLFFNYLTRLIMRPRYKINLISFPTTDNHPSLLIDPIRTVKEMLFLAAAESSLQFYIAKETRSIRDPITTLFTGVRYIYTKNKIAMMTQFVEASEKSIQKQRQPCLFLPSPSILHSQPFQKQLKEIKKRYSFEIKLVQTDNLTEKLRGKPSLFKKQQITITFSEDILH